MAVQPKWRRQILIQGHKCMYVLKRNIAGVKRQGLNLRETIGAPGMVT